MNITQKELLLFKRLYFEGIGTDGKLATICTNSVQNTAKVMGFSIDKTKATVAYFEDVAKRTNESNINTLAGLDRLADVDIYKYYKKAFKFDLLQYVSDDGDINIQELRKKGFGDIITKFKRSDKGELDISFVNKNEATQQIQLLKEKSKNTHQSKKKHNILSFFKDKEINIEEVKNKLEKLKKI